MEKVSEKSPVGAVILVLAFSGRAERALLGSGLEKTRGGIFQYKGCRCTLKMSRKAKTEIPVCGQCVSDV